MFARLLAAALLMFGTLAYAADDKVKLPDGPGKETTQRLCGTCHGAEIVVGEI